MSVQPPPEATVPRPEPVSDEVSRHHELNLQPLGSRKKEVTPIAEAIPPAAAASPNRWFQPTAAIPPATPVANQASQPLFPSDTPLKSFSQQQEARNRRHGMIVAAILIAALLVFGGSVLVYTVLNTRKTNDPKAVFNSMLSKNLATKQLHQSVVESKTGTTVQADYDVSDVTKPRILATAHTGGDANKVVTKYFSTFQNTFVQYQNTDGGTEAYLNKWVQVRNNGVLQPNSERTLASTFEARRIFFGQIVFGNFSSSDKKSLESAFKDNVFSYDKNKVKTETLGDDKTFIYEVKIDADKLVAYNQKVARMVGINPDEVNKESLQSVTSAMLYVDAATQRLLRLVTSDATINYSNYNSVAIQPQPASQMSWSDFLAANEPSGSTSGTASTSDADTTTSSGGTSSGAGSDGTPDQSSGSSDANFDDPNFDDPLWDGDAGEN